MSGAGCDGFLNLLKPPGPTSHDLVAHCRRLLGQRAGHTGTLDPGAAGVLVIACGRATRLVRYLQTSDKSYRVEMTLGVATATEDRAGKVLAVADAGRVSRSNLERVLKHRLGPGLQVPPMVSAVKRDGVPLHRLARQGKEVPRQPRPVFWHRLQLLDFEAGARATAWLDVTCSAGTYMRTLCADVGEELGVGGHLAFLVRTASGRFHLTASVTLEQLETAVRAGTAADLLVPPVVAMNQFPLLVVEGQARARLLHGNPVDVVEGREGTVAVTDGRGHLLAMAELVRRQGQLRLLPRVVVGEEDGACR